MEHFIERGELAKARSKDWASHNRPQESLRDKQEAKVLGHKAGKKKEEMAKKMLQRPAPPRSRTGDAAAGGVNR